MNAMNAGRGTNRGIIAVAAVLMQIALGGVYGWSVFVKPLIAAAKANHVVWTLPQVTLTFTISIFTLGFASALGGYWMSRVGPRIVATTAAVFYGLGVLGAGFATSLPLLYLTYGLLGGIGLGLGYIVPLAVLIKWFPDRRGFITGIAVCGFGGGAVLIALVAPQMIMSLGVYPTFVYLGIFYLVVVAICAQFYRNPPDGYVPAGWTPSASLAAQRSARDYRVSEALRNPQWWVLWAILALNVTVGIALISVASPFAQSPESAHVAAATAAGLVIAISVFNAIGRFFWASVSDVIGRRNTFLAIFGIQVIAFLLIVLLAHNFVLLLILGCVVGLCYGGGFGTMPAFAADFFGPKYAGQVYGAMLTAWSFGGVIGPLAIANIKQNTGSYIPAFYVAAVIALVSLVLPLLARRPTEESTPQRQIAQATD